VRLPRRGLELAGLALVVLALAGCARAAGDAFQATVTRALPADAEPVGQTFRPGAERLAGVDVLTATFGQTPDDGGELVVSLLDRAGGAAAPGEVVATASVPGEAVADNAWVPLRFDQPVAAPPRAAFTVEWTGDSPVGVWANVPPAETNHQARLLNDPYGGGQLLRGGQPATGDLAFRVVGDVGPVQPLAAVGRLAAGAGRALATAPGFGLALAAAMAAAVALAISGFVGARRRR
jgi:hypothetical protein